MNEAPIQIRHEPGQGRFVASVDGHEAELDYTLQSQLLRITHTGVPEAIGGRGVAAQLVGAAVDYARAQGYRVRADCAYAAQYFQRHPDIQDLLA